VFRIAEIIFRFQWLKVFGSGFGVWKFGEHV